MLDLLRERQDAGVAVHIIGSDSEERLPALKLKGLRLHTRTLIRDRTEAFLGSQSLRRVELDRRREIGIIFCDEAVVRQMVETFAKDWQASSLESLNVELASPGEPPRKSPIGVIQSLVRRIPFPSLAKHVRKLIPKRRRRDKRRIRGGLSKLVTNVVSIW